MGFTLGIYGAEDETGWSSFTVSEPSGEGSTHVGAGTRKIYVDSAAADDTGAGTEAAPKKTITAGLALLRNGKPDHLYLKRGGEWIESFGIIEKGGLSEQERMIISTYGTGARPLVKVASIGRAIGFQAADTNGSNFAVIGLDFYAYKRDPNSGDFDYAEARQVGRQGISVVSGVQNFLLEDCRFRYFHTNASLNFSIAGRPGDNVVVRRNVFAHSYSGAADGHSQGIFFSTVENWYFEENFLDHNGWNEELWQPETVTITNASPAVVTWTGHDRLEEGDLVQFTNSGGALPTGLVAYTLYYVRNLLGDDFNVSTTASGSLTNTSSNGSGTQQARWGNPHPNIFNHNVYMANDSGPVVARGNISARASSHGMQCRPGGTVTDNLFVNNSMGFFVGWVPSDVQLNVVTEGKDIDPAQGRRYGMGVQDLSASGTLFKNNIVAHRASGVGNQPYIEVTESSEENGIPEGVIFDSNIVYDWDSSLNDEAETTVFTDNEIDGEGYVAADRSVASYNADILEGEETLADFLETCIDMNEANWDERYTAPRVNDYIRGGFNRRRRMTVSLGA